MTLLKVTRAVLGLATLVVAGVGPALWAAGAEQFDPQTKTRIERFEQGPATIDVSKYPRDMQKNYEIFSQKCSHCNKLSRPINANFTRPADWSSCIGRMMNKPGADISKADGEKIRDFLVYDGSLRTKPSDVELAKAGAPTAERPPGQQPPAAAGQQPPVAAGQQPPRTRGTAGDFVLFLGRFHPLLVHLPIGGLVWLGILELLAKFSRFKNAAPNSQVLLGLVSIAALTAAIFGWLLSHASGYDEQLLQWHKWAGISVAVSCLAAFLLRLLDRQLAYRVCLNRAKPTGAACPPRPPPQSESRGAIGATSPIPKKRRVKNIETRKTASQRVLKLWGAPLVFKPCTFRRT